MKVVLRRPHSAFFMSSMGHDHDASSQRQWPAENGRYAGCGAPCQLASVTVIMVLLLLSHLSHIQARLDLNSG